MAESFGSRWTRLSKLGQPEKAMMIWRDFHDSRQMNTLSGAIKMLRAN